MKVLCTVILILLIVLVAASLFAGNYFYNLALNLKADRTAVFNAPHNTIDTDGAVYGQRRRDNEAWLQSVSSAEGKIQAEDGTTLHGYCIVREEPTHKWVVACHGYSASALQMVSTARSFYELGYNVLLPDLRGHGASGGDYIGMGWHDRRDIISWVNTIIADYGQSVEIVLYGVSMGGATVMMTAGEDDLPSNVKAVVEDCGYTTAMDEFAYQLKALYNLPAFPLMNAASLVTRLRAGYFLGEASAVAQVAKAAVPILFIHGEEDTFVPAYMLDLVYDACASEKEKLLVPGAGHGGARGADPVLYDTTIQRFLSRYVSE